MSHKNGTFVVASIDLHRDGQVTVDWPLGSAVSMDIEELRAVASAASAALEGWNVGDLPQLQRGEQDA